MSTILSHYQWNLIFIYRYKPGDIVILIAGALYHGVGQWEPKGSATADLVTPGRIGHVFFSQKSALNRLEGKRPYWAVDTCGGVFPSSSHQKLDTLKGSI